eukprot:2409172-Prymnesium_polylepis.4
MVGLLESYTRIAVAKKVRPETTSSSQARNAIAYDCTLPRMLRVLMFADASATGSRNIKCPSASTAHSPGASKAAAQPSMKYRRVTQCSLLTIALHPLKDTLVAARSAPVEYAASIMWPQAVTADVCRAHVESRSHDSVVQRSVLGHRAGVRGAPSTKSCHGSVSLL